MLTLALFLLKRAKLSIEDRNRLASLVLDKLQATPLKDVISYDSAGTLLLNGREVEIEVARALRESAKNALDSSALRLITESVKYRSFVVAAINATKSEELLFGKAAIWFCQEQEKLLKMLAGVSEIEKELE